MKILTEQQRQLIIDSGLFDAEWYSEKYQDVQKVGLAPLEHFLRIGGFISRSPGPLFDAKYYLNQVAEEWEVVFPLLDYLEVGWKKNINPNPLFDIKWFLLTNSDIKNAGIEPLTHYFHYGGFEGRNSHKSFNSKKVLEYLKERRLHNINPLSFYLSKEWTQDPCPEATLFLNKSVSDETNCGIYFDHILDKQFGIVPIYLNELQYECNTIPSASIGVHLHLYYIDQLDNCIQHLKNIPSKFNLFISLCNEIILSVDKEILQKELPLASSITIEVVPNKGRDIAPLIIQFGNRLLKHDYILHIHTKKSNYNDKLKHWGKNIFKKILGSCEEVSSILALLGKDAKYVYPEEELSYVPDPRGWDVNYDIATRCATKYGFLTDFNKYKEVCYPQGSMYWCTAKAATKFLSLPLTWEDFPEEPIPQDGTIAHALERLVFVLAESVRGKNYKIVNGAIDINRLYYECQNNYTDSIKHETIKILAYYLPQFHPTPENDEWHGVGFTEWTKTKAANPLFYGHYQQHIPHQDIGFYLLDDTSVLKKQASMMHAAGVHGMIFYHYWFGGRLILEKPAKMLLNDPSVSMPFCFCWANENWTKRWDGNEQDILLEQKYSAEDAKGFIEYLMPFFKDSRYIRVDGRPMLFIYRPDSIPDIHEYIQVWEDVCELHGEPKPYVVATLTRGAVSPVPYSCDAGAERVLHDWTNGGAKDIKNELHFFDSFNGNIIRYEDIADYYSKQNAARDYSYFRSIVPQWDNTARYGSEAYIVHDSNPEIFQKWLETLIKQTEENLPENKRFIIVNAWNEWAEGAHLEPDLQFGYAYLNSVGRALSDHPFSENPSEISAPKKMTTLRIEIPENLLGDILKNSDFSAKFFHILKNTSLFKNSQIKTFLDKSCYDIFSSHGISTIECSELTDCDYTLSFRRPCLFTLDGLERMLDMAWRHPNSRILANTYDSQSDFAEVRGHFSTPHWAGFQAAIVLESREPVLCSKICPGMMAFVTDLSNTNKNRPEVTTIVRYHRSGSMAELERAILSLVVMGGVKVLPVICAQDLDENQKIKLKEMCKSIADDCINIEYYTSTLKEPDLRSKMLNEGFLNAKTQFVGFLDYDDLLMPHAYDFLIKRLKETNKAVAFGRVFSTEYDTTNGILLKRRKDFEYNCSYEEFINQNHAPLHSFLIDTHKIEKEKIVYHEYHTYMEDYFLMLQIINESNTDWESLLINCYIGDYIHPINRNSTLGINDIDKKLSLLNDEIYMRCENYINQLRFKLGSK